MKNTDILNLNCGSLLHETGEVNEWLNTQEPLSAKPAIEEAISLPPSTRSGTSITLTSQSLQ